MKTQKKHIVNQTLFNEKLDHSIYFLRICWQVRPFVFKILFRLTEAKGYVAKFPKIFFREMKENFHKILKFANCMSVCVQSLHT